MKVEIKKIDLKTNTQSRVEINQNTVNEYATDLKEGAKFPPIILFQNKTGSTHSTGSMRAGSPQESYYIGDGWHRILAYKKAGKKNIDAEIKQGFKRDAVLYSVGSNAAHGLRRTNEDKRKSVTMLLEDAEWVQWSNREIAKKAIVSPGIVDKMRKELSAYNRQIGSKKVKRGGKQYTISTENIGQNAKKAVKREKLEATSTGQAKATTYGNSVDITNTTNIANNGSQENEVSGYRKFNIFGWEILIKKENPKMKNKKIMKTTEA